MKSFYYFCIDQYIWTIKKYYTIAAKYHEILFVEVVSMSHEVMKIVVA